MVMGPTLMSAAASTGLDHDQDVPKRLRVRVHFEFLLNLIRKWVPDGHGAHPDVGGGVGGGIGGS